MSPAFVKSALIVAAFAARGVAQTPAVDPAPSAPRGVKAVLSAARASQAAFESSALTLTLSLDKSAAPLSGLSRSELVRAKCVVAAGPDRQGKWTTTETSTPAGAVDLLPGESFSLPLTVRLPELAGATSATLQWIGTGALKGVRSNELSIVIRDGKNPVATLDTAEGIIVLELWPESAPNHVANFIALADKGFYDGLKWHRVVPNFVVQTGCPKGDGSGDAGYKIPAEFNDMPFTKGVLGMARSGGDNDSAGSQFFICVADAAALNKQYTAFGRVLEGQDVADKISNVAREPGKERPMKDVVLRKATVARPPGYEPPVVKKV
jgi:peptidyl-prolyl cis-trans isomerase B (cyclophilin B)